MKFNVLAVDIAKEVFQVHGIRARSRSPLSRRVRRQEFLSVMRGFAPSLVVIEAGWSAHYWGREIEKLGHKVKLIAPQHVKPFVQTNKSDRNDAAAIAEAAQRPGMKFVSVKSVEQQEIQMLHRVRARCVRQRTAVCNEARGFLCEQGIVIRLGVKAVREKLKELLLDTSGDISWLFQEILRRLYDELKWLDQQVLDYDQKILQIAKAHPMCQRIQMMKGVGPLIATAMLSTVGDAQKFKNGRAFSANLGLVPRHAGTGGRNKTGSISKRGDVYVRQLLIHGARSALYSAKKRTDKHSLWCINVMERVGFNKAVVALANKNARIIWKLMTTDMSYNPNMAAA